MGKTHSKDEKDVSDGENLDITDFIVVEFAEQSKMQLSITTEELCQDTPVVNNECTTSAVVRPILSEKPDDYKPPTAVVRPRTVKQQLTIVDFSWPQIPCEVLVSGSFDNWQTKFPLTKNSDGAHQLVAKLPPGRYEYKYIVNGYWVHDKSKDTTDDHFGGLNNLIEILDAPEAACDSSSTAGICPVTLDEPLFALLCEWNFLPNEVLICGSFNNWQEKLPLLKCCDMFEIVMNLCPGSYEYKFIVDGRWMHDMNKKTTDDHFGGLNNVIHVT